MSMFKPFSMHESKPKTEIHGTYRSPDVYAAYNEQLKRARTGSQSCALCDDSRQTVHDYGVVRVIKNDYPYAVFEGLPVREHVMVVTARHIGLLGELTREEARTYWRVCAEYSDKSYTMLTQAATKSQRSIPGHIHTHLLLCNDDR